MLQLSIANELFIYPSTYKKQHFISKIASKFSVVTKYYE
ncbi:hypothetical protein GMES_1444 [Paraglaciecola mesophila KMM 241]|uniref:Uncharacterized protein n=1 Tax=Paraglaciecola mesophila KMM 241 TaxID=1128912 RepID=K6Z416_9ALTE|nr:hypothetical protein GMES_1444 [Paraglaciecola mesophila KMM 241]